ncbi:hypothetical protein PTTG_11862 [Puccinia triticina 1-1 BBBD Race 1]|uniref:Zinc-ribbon 15 domain-containing protein n=1 Tax=Puccinia triticina (isolate 1-1 / race 1 (BBBD)) TaxID=630390 RepID=A0A180GPG2_PUCT1|nr:hypothetical protein PTTG_11862 [Puccinia triticina 1-1 BBBD Race 1]
MSAGQSLQGDASDARQVANSCGAGPTLRPQNPAQSTHHHHARPYHPTECCIGCASSSLSNSAVPPKSLRSTPRKTRMWFEFCFLPIIPFKSKKVWICSICRWQAINDGTGPQAISNIPPPGGGYAAQPPMTAPNVAHTKV